MQRESVNGVVLYRFEGLRGVSGVTHAILTRLGGVSKGPFAELNLGHTVGDHLDAVEENHRRGLGALGLVPEDVITAHQVHSAHVEVVGRNLLGTVRPATDALVSDDPGVALLMRFADCVPVALYDAERRVVAIAHVGWRGVVAGVVLETVDVMSRHFGCNPAELWAGVGPAIGPCCFEVGADVAEMVAAACPPEADIVCVHDSRTTVDLPGAVGAQLGSTGVRNIEQSGLCTACHVDEFFSHRAEHGKTGRFGMILGLVE